MTEIPLGSRDDIHSGGGVGGEKSSPVAFPIPSEELGLVSISPSGSFEAGSYQTFTLVYTAGKFGIDDSGSMRICFRFASDQTRPCLVTSKSETNPHRARVINTKFPRCVNQCKRLIASSFK